MSHEPSVISVPSDRHPTIPAGWHNTVLSGPNVLDSAPNSPVLQYGGYTYWAYSNMDNRVSMNIAAYDADGHIVKQWEKTGARYLYKITVDSEAKTVTFWGQSDAKVVMSWYELLPSVISVPSDRHPTIPAGWHNTVLSGPNVLDSAPNSPVLQYGGYTYWAYSNMDNRVSMNIVAYDAGGNIVKQWEKTGARYLYKIMVDSEAKTVTFWGQSDAKVVMSWDELMIAAEEKETPQVPPSFEVPGNSPAGYEFTNTQNVPASYTFTPSGNWSPDKSNPHLTECMAVGFPSFNVYVQDGVKQSWPSIESDMKYPKNTPFALIAENTKTGEAIEVGKETKIVLNPGENLRFVLNDAIWNYDNNGGSIKVDWTMGS